MKNDTHNLRTDYPYFWKVVAWCPDIADRLKFYERVAIPVLAKKYGTIRNKQCNPVGHPCAVDWSDYYEDDSEEIQELLKIYEGGEPENV